ncbi:hypothetical protein KL921_000539 [Ogataea angusta]|nr:hypothetical protein KL921_000539 [Ogataea angusta]KAG7837067.1 hypothetical protein KL943_001106 [Ogataea angusta]KAG7863221.1 hypothetical protein KL939_000540 [Ogataea angusta]
MLRHASRADKHDSDWSSMKSDPRVNHSDHWLAAYDPPIDPFRAINEVDLAYKKISSHIPTASRIFMHCSPYNRCVQTARLLANQFVHTESGIQSQKHQGIQRKLKLRIDQGLSEWLNENFRLEHLPPNDGGASMISNVNLYLENTLTSLPMTDDERSKLKALRDFDWLHNKFGKCGDYGEKPSEFQIRCANYLASLVRYYETHVPEELKEDSVILIITHGALISMFLEIILGRRNFSEIPVCTPIYLKNGRPECYLFKDYDFNLKSLVPVTKDQEFYHLLDKEFKLKDLNSKATTEDQLARFTPDVSQLVACNSPATHRPRSRTINVVGPTVDSNNKFSAPLRQVRSSKQLHLMDSTAKEGKILDLNKLEGFLGVTSDSDDESDVQLCNQGSSGSETEDSSSDLLLGEDIIVSDSNSFQDIVGHRNSMSKIKNSGFTISPGPNFEIQHQKCERRTEAFSKESRSSTSSTAPFESKHSTLEEMSAQDDCKSEILPFVQSNDEVHKKANTKSQNIHTYRLAQKSKGSLKRILFGSPDKQMQHCDESLTWLGSNIKKQVA